MSLTAVLAASVLAAQGRSLMVNVSFRDRMAMGTGTMLVVRLERSGVGMDDMNRGGNRDRDRDRDQDWPRNGGMGGSMPDQRGWGDSSVISELRMALSGESSPIRIALPYSYDDQMGAGGYALRAMLLRNGQVVMGSDRAVPVRLSRSNRTYTINLSDMSNGNGSNGDRGEMGGWQMAQLRGSTWEVTEVDGRQVGWSERKPSLTFDENGTDIRGFSGVNGFGATYSGDAQNLRLTMGMHTMMAGNDAQMDVENRLFRVLPTVSRMTRSGQGLVLWANDRAVVRLQRARS